MKKAKGEQDEGRRDGLVLANYLLTTGSETLLFIPAPENDRQHVYMYTQKASTVSSSSGQILIYSSELKHLGKR